MISLSRSVGLLNPLTPMSDQERISPYNINAISTRLVSKIKKKSYLGDYRLIQYQILQTNIRRTIWQTVRRINNEILGVKGLRNGKNAISKSIETHDLVKVTVFSTDSFNGFRLERGHALKSHSQQQQNMFS